MGAVGSGMGGAGGAFAQSFANTLIQGQQIMASIADRREHLDLQKKLAGAQLQEHDAKTALATRALKGVTDLQARLTPQSWPDSELGGGGGTTPAPLSEPERLQYALQIDPHGAAKEMLAGGRRVSLQDMMTAGNAWMGGAGQPGAGVPTRATPADTALPAAAPVTDQPTAGAAPTPALGPTTKLDRSFSVVIDKNGDPKLDLKVGEKHIALDMKHEFEPLPDGRIQNYRAIFNPDTGAVTRTLVGAPQLPATQQAYAQTAIAWGLKPGTETFAMAIADQAAAATMYQGNAQTLAFEDLAKSYRAMAGGKAPAAAPATSPLARAQATEVQQGAAKVKAEAEARLSVPEKASPAERDKLAGQMSGTDLYGQIRALYKPEMVGPFKGGPSARVREVSGAMSQQEQQFRTAVTTANNQMIKDITGAQMSEPESQRLMRQMPDPTLPSGQFEARLKQTQINQKIIAIRRRQVMEGTGVDMKGVPTITLSTEERRQVINPILQDLRLGQIDKAEAMRQLMGLGQYDERAARTAVNDPSLGIK